MDSFIIALVLRNFLSNFDPSKKPASDPKVSETTSLRCPSNPPHCDVLGTIYAPPLAKLDKPLHLGP